MTREPRPQPSDAEIDAKLEAEKELVERFAASADPELLGELMEKVTGAKVREIKKGRPAQSVRPTPAG